MSSEEMFKTPPAQSEYVTRKQIVDRKLRDAGWKIARFDETRALAAYERCAILRPPA
jgi:predicted type IV restriction endonuclease